MNSNQNEKSYLTNAYYICKNIDLEKEIPESDNLSDDEVLEYGFINAVKSYIDMNQPEDYELKDGSKASIFDLQYYKTNICQLMNSKLSQGATVSDLAEDLVSFQEKFLRLYKKTNSDINNLYIGHKQNNKAYKFDTIINDDDTLIDQKAKQNIFYFGKDDARSAVYYVFDNNMLQANINSMITNTDSRIDKNEKIERLMFYKRINDFCRDKPTGGFFSNIKVKSYLKQFEDKLIAVGFTKQELDRVKNASDDELLEITNEVSENSKLLDFKNLVKLNNETNKYECNITDKLNPENLSYITNEYKTYLSTKHNLAVKDNVVAIMLNTYKMFKQKHDSRGILSKIFNSKVRQEGRDIDAFEKALKERVGFSSVKLNELYTSDTYYVASDIADLKASIPTLNVTVAVKKPIDEVPVIVEGENESNKVFSSEVSNEPVESLEKEEVLDLGEK